MDSLAGAEIILYNGPNSDIKKVYSQQKYDSILQALDNRSKLKLTFIDPDFTLAKSQNMLVHIVIASEWQVDWNIKETGNLITAQSGGVIINYICEMISGPEREQLTGQGAKMFKDETPSYQPQHLARRT